MSMTYEEMMQQLQYNRSNSSKSVIGNFFKWNYGEPYKMICLDCKEEFPKVELTFAFKVDDEYVQKKQEYTVDGNAAFFWKQFIENAFPNVSEELTIDMIIGRPFVAEIIKNGNFDNLHVLSGYTGDFPEDVEGL